MLEGSRPGISLDDYVSQREERDPKFKAAREVHLQELEKIHKSLEKREKEIFDPNWLSSIDVTGIFFKGPIKYTVEGEKEKISAEINGFVFATTQIVEGNRRTTFNGISDENGSIGVTFTDSKLGYLAWGNDGPIELDKIAEPLGIQL